MSPPRTNLPLRVTIVVLSAAALWACASLWPALVLAAWTAAILRPLLDRFERTLRGRRRAASAVALLLFLLLAAPIGLVVLGVISGGQEVAHAVMESASAKAAFQSLASGNGGTGELPKDLPSALDLVQRYGGQGASMLSRFAGAAANGFIALFIYFGGSYVFLLDGPRIWAWCKERSPLRVAELERLGAAFHETGRGLLVGVGLTTLTQGVVATIVYAALGVPRWWVLGAITGIASIIPVVGSGMVWGPIAVGLFLSGHPIKASILAVLGVGVISTVDNVLRPMYARMGALKMPMYLLFVSVFGGMAAFGTWGAILGPLVVRLWMEALELRREAKDAAPDDEPEKTEEPADDVSGE